MKQILSTALVVAALALPLAAQAADAPSYTMPSGDDSVHGVISGFNGKYGLTVRDSHGYIDNVTMHQGTIINPTGLALQPGMQVAILGHAEGDTFAANEIDTPVQLQDIVPGGYGYGYYPATDYSFGFGWGRSGGFRGGVGW